MAAPALAGPVMVFPAFPAVEKRCGAPFRQPLDIAAAYNVVHPQNVRFKNVRFQNIWYQNVRFQNVRFTKRQVYKMSGFKTSGFKTSCF
jgi:hypothetical protein